MLLLGYDRGVAVRLCVSTASDVQWLRSKDRHAVTNITDSNLRSPRDHLVGDFLFVITLGA